MITKKELLEAALRGEGCLGKAADDEPVFLLRAQDWIAADLVDSWAVRVSAINGSSEKTAEARLIAVMMRSWPIRKAPD